MHLELSIVLCLGIILGADSIMFHLPPGGHKCLREELKQNILVTGEYYISEAPGQKVDYKVTDSKGNILDQHDDTHKGKFSFVTENQNVFEICFYSRITTHMTGVAQEVTLNTKRGVEAKAYEGMSEAAKLKPIEVDLKRLEDLSDSVVQDFILMRDREKEMRDTNESTNNRVLYLSIFSMCCLLGLAVWQVLYLRRFFKAKKLIE